MGVRQEEASTQAYSFSKHAQEEHTAGKKS